MNRLTRGTLLAAAIMLLAAMPARAQIVNGSFEDDYNGWTLEEVPPAVACVGTWGIANTGSPQPPVLLTETGSPLLQGGVAFDFHDGALCSQSSPSLPITFAPTDGVKLAFQLQSDVPQLHRMHQDIAVGPGSSLHWDMQYNNHAGASDPSQYLAVRIRDSVSDAILADLFTTTNPGVPQSIPMTGFSADLAAFAGMTVRLSVDMQVSLDFFDAQFDNFRLTGNCTPPVIASVTAAPSVIWPPNQKMVLVTVSVDATATCGPPVCKIVAITIDEPSRGRGDDDGDEPSGDRDDDKARPDTRIVSDFTAEVRAVRAGGSLGRTYTITVECTDTAGNTTRKDTQVFVPHDRRKHDRREDDRRDDDRSE